jgi:hypothetical protein
MAGIGRSITGLRRSDSFQHYPRNNGRKMLGAQRFTLAVFRSFC